MLAIYGDGQFTADGADYTVVNNDGQFFINSADGETFCAVSTFVVRRFNGEDTLDIAFKDMTRDVVAKMEEENLTTASFTYKIPQLDENGLVVTDENGNAVLVESELTVQDKVTDYVVVCEQYTNMIDRFAAPSDAHIFGTDGDGRHTFFNLTSAEMYAAHPRTEESALFVPDCTATEYAYQKESAAA
jgi:hypothetical protein